ncbi:MAG: toxin-antitoxin system, antitoxin component, Xre family protein [Planctomycetes bacterium]|nr:toxin-antitoxin system, antitoxin component, Xre family protein [Planctomycetota bacterium]
MTVKEELIEEIEKLPEELAQEVFRFLRFIESEEEKRSLAKSAQKMSESSFEKYWDNELDAECDNG